MLMNSNNKWSINFVVEISSFVFSFFNFFFLCADVFNKILLLEFVYRRIWKMLRWFKSRFNSKSERIGLWARQVREKMLVLSMWNFPASNHSSLVWFFKKLIESSPTWTSISCLISLLAESFKTKLIYINNE